MLLKKKIVIILFWGCAGSTLLRLGFVWLGLVGATLCCSAWASHRGERLLLLQSTVSRRVGAQTSVVVAHRSCRMRA